ncbi:hypothetical protein PV341_27220 [Streptomyces sp. PA03-1a]|nr:hypothetical protein [Streptomyces sp. PA03-1a]MDX2812496.1 hypothetical protein [Streptomyces sp. PA03-5A]
MGTYKDAVTGAVRTVSGGSLSVDAPGKGNLRVYVLDLGGANAAPGKVGSDGPYLSSTPYPRTVPAPREVPAAAGRPRWGGHPGEVPGPPGVSSPRDPVI